jgi:hypothetical protein
MAIDMIAEFGGKGEKSRLGLVAHRTVNEISKLLLDTEESPGLHGVSRRFDIFDLHSSQSRDNVVESRIAHG